jgi:bifunctional non-homologous end joining protein LigD
MASDSQHELALFAFDLMHHDGEDLRPLQLLERRLRLTELLLRSDVPCLHLVQAFDDGVKLLEAAEPHGLKGIVSKRKASSYRSGPSHDWVKAKTAAWRKANRDRWKAFQRERQR